LSTSPGSFDRSASPAGAPSAPAGLTSHSAGILLVLAAALFWSTGGVALKSLTLPSLTIAGVRALIAGVVLSPFLPRLAWRWDWRLLPLLGGYTGTVLCFTAAIRLTTAANAIALVYTAPAWVYGLTCLAERRVPWRLFLPVALILAGLGIILAEPAHGASATGNLLGLLAGLAFGLFTFLVPRLQQPPIALVSLCNLFAGTFLFLLFPGALLPGAITARDWATLAFLGIVQIALGHLFFTAALKRIPATQASVLALAEPLLNPVWVFLLLGEVPSGHGFAGLAVILGGVCADLGLRRKARRPPAADSPVASAILSGPPPPAA
jgi:DME family drug/metabolite transporter